MDRRLKFREELADVMEDCKLYFQPPNGTKLKYPCAIYKLQNIDIDHADDKVYKNMKGYQVTIIDADPDSAYPDRLMDQFRHIRFDRFFTNDNLNHYVFTIYY